MNISPSSQASGSSLPRIIFALAIAFVLMVLAGAGAFYFMFVKVPTAAVRNARIEAADAARQISSAIKEFLNFTPEVRIGNRTVIEQESPVTELATVQQHLMVEHDWVHTWAGSTKTIVLEGTFLAKAGFDLQQPFQVTIEEEPLAVRATLPESKLLSIEMKDYRVRKDEDGWWNTVKSADREEALRGMMMEARTRVRRTGILRKAERQLDQQLRHALAERGVAPSVNLDLTFRHPTAASSSEHEATAPQDDPPAP